MTFVSNGSKLDSNNSSTATLNAGVTFTGTATDAGAFPAITVAVITDQDGTLYVDFSPDSSNWDSTLSFAVEAATSEVHRIVVTRKYMRVRFTNTSASNQTYFRLQTQLGFFTQLNSSINSVLQSDADAATVRALSEETLTAEGKYQNRTIVNKFGRNSDIDTGSVPEDIWNGGGTYKGFPTGAAEEFEVFSSSASDTGTLTFTYLASATATAYTTATVTMNGTTAVNTGVSGIRMDTARYDSGSSTTFNVGTITIRHRVTTANVFCVMPIGRSQTNAAAYTIPYGSTGYLRRLFCRVIGTASGTVDGALWVRESGSSPRLRRPFSAATSDRFEEYPYGGLVLPALSDIMVRISSVSANNMDVIAGYDLVIVKS